MALGVDGMRARRVIFKSVLLTVGTLGFVVCLTLVYESMRSVMDIGGSCASGGPYTINRPCPEGVAWVMPVAIFGMLFFTAMSLLASFSEGGPRPYVFAWSALFLALGWNFLEYGFDAPGGGTSVSWLVCGFVFVAMGGIPLLGLFWKTAARWALWGPAEEPLRPTPTRAPSSPSPHTPAPAAAGGLVLAPTPVVATSPTFGLPLSPTQPDANEAEPEAEPEPEAERDVVDRLERLADLREKGLIDEQEYEQVKDKILRDEVGP
jgi:hypothetical protein